MRSCITLIFAVICLSATAQNVFEKFGIPADKTNDYKLVSIGGTKYWPLLQKPAARMKLENELLKEVRAIGETNSVAAESKAIAYHNEMTVHFKRLYHRKFPE